MHNSAFDILLTAIFELAGYCFVKHDSEPAPMLLGLVLGPMMEESLRHAMVISNGDTMVFVTRPISAALLMIAAALLVVAILPMIRRRREQVFVG